MENTILRLTVAAALGWGLALILFILLIVRNKNCKTLSKKLVEQKQGECSVRGYRD